MEGSGWSSSDIPQVNIQTTATTNECHALLRRCRAQGRVATAGMGRLIVTVVVADKTSRD